MKKFLKVSLTIVSLSSFFIATQANSQSVAMGGVLVSTISTIVLLGLLEAFHLIREEFQGITGW